MPRSPRIEVPGGIHHVCNHAVEGRELFLDHNDRRRFLRTLGDVAGPRGWLCLSYCLMGNHLHLLLETPEPNLSDGMRVLESSHAEAMNLREGKRGHLFHGRFTWKHVDTAAYFAHVLRYIALNPVNAGVCRHPSDSDWTSHRAQTGGGGHDLVAVERVQELLGEWGGEPERRYVRLFDHASPWGDWSTAITPDPPRPSVSEIVASTAGESKEAMRVARWTFGYTLRDIALALNVSESTVSRNTRR